MSSAAYRRRIFPALNNVQKQNCLRLGQTGPVACFSFFIFYFGRKTGYNNAA
jgi:hypothetical protein